MGRSRISREERVSDFACGELAKVAVGRGFLHLGLLFGEVTAGLGKTRSKWINVLDRSA